MNTIDTFSDPFPCSQWWVKLLKIACMQTQRRYRRDRQTRFAVEIEDIYLSLSVCTVTNKTIVSTSFFFASLTDIAFCVFGHLYIRVCKHCRILTVL